MDSSEFSRAELIGLLLRMVFLGSITAYTLKYMVNILDPTNKQKKDAHKRARCIVDKLNLSDLKTTLNEHELVIASNLIDPQSIDVSWKDIGGLNEVIDDIKTEVIIPLKLPQIFNNSAHHRPPTGVLLHGPPGCGKTMLAKATAREAGARFINLELAMLTDKWYGESQKLAKAVFTLAQKIEPCIIFIDEIDSFLRVRDSHDHEATAMVKAQFMTLWDGLDTQKDCKVVILGATNRPRDVDKAILRRMPAMYSIGLPDAQKRKQILKAMIEPGSIDLLVDVETISQLTEDFSGSDLRELHRAASMVRVKEFSKYHPELFESFNIDSCSSSTTSENYSVINGTSDNQTLRQITMDDYVTVIQRMIESRRQLGTGHAHMH